MEGEGEEAADEEGEVGGPSFASDGSCGSEEESDCRYRSDAVLEGEVEELVVGVGWGIVLALVMDQDGVDGSSAVAPKVEEVVKGSPDQPAEGISGVVLD